MKIPEVGFYYHYKHNTQESFNNYTYEVVGVARHSEDKNYLVLYRPLYENTYLGQALYTVRPLDMFMESVIFDGKTSPRFWKVTDPEVISKLEKVKEGMYP